MSDILLPGDAGFADVLNGKKFTSKNGYNIAGTIPVVAGGNTITPNTAAQQAIAAGSYAQAAINVAGDANLLAANIRSDKSIFGVTGSIPIVAGGNTITPNTATQQAIAAGNLATSAINVAGDANLVAGNILSGKTIFGVAGSLIQGKQATSGRVLLGTGATNGSFPLSVATGVGYSVGYIVLVPSYSNDGGVTFQYGSSFPAVRYVSWNGITNITIQSSSYATHIMANYTGFSAGTLTGTIYYDQFTYPIYCDWLIVQA